MAIFIFVILAMVQFIKKDKVKSKKQIKLTGISFAVMIVSFIAFGVTSDSKAEPTEVVAESPKEEVKKPEETEAEKTTREQKEVEDKVKADQQAKEVAEAKAKAEDEAKAAAEQKAKEESIPREYKSALKKAESYANNMDMSKAGIYDQLVSEYGENYPAEAAQYAIDNIEYNWKENALKKAQSYAETMDMSDSAIYDQLISEYGEKFTPEEAQYAIDNLE